MEQLQYHEGRTELSSLGRQALIDRLTQGTACGKDDCAVIGEGNTRTLVSTQTLVEGVDFDMMYTPLKHLGYKAVAITVSNIVAMNGTPRQVMVNLAVSNRYSVEALDELYTGIHLCCRRYDLQLVGGDTRTTRNGMTLSVTAIGNVDEDKITYRHGAHPNDLICVSGDLGSAYAGLLVLEREKVTYQANPNFQPDLDGYDYILERILKPEPRTDIQHALNERGVVPTSMIDVSRGLADAALHLCHASKVGCEIYEERIPIDYQVTRVCSELSKNMLPVSCALNGGEDYELLFTVAQVDYDKIKTIEGIHIIGYCTETGLTPVMVTPQNTTITLRAQAFESAQQ